MEKTEWDGMVMLYSKDGRTTVAKESATMNSIKTQKEGKNQ